MKIFGSSTKYDLYRKFYVSSSDIRPEKKLNEIPYDSTNLNNVLRMIQLRQIHQHFSELICIYLSFALIVIASEKIVFYVEMRVEDYDPLRRITHPKCIRCKATNKLPIVSYTTTKWEVRV